MKISINPITRLITAMGLVGLTCLATARPIGGSESDTINWSDAQISQTIAVHGVYYGLGNSGFGGGNNETVREIAGRQCIVGPLFTFNVLDGYAYDIDENVEIEVDIEPSSSSQKITVLYDKNDGFGRKDIPINAASDSHWYTVKATLDRAKFAGRGPLKTDLAIGASSAFAPFTPAGTRSVTICGIRLKRSFTTKAVPAFGDLTLEILNEHGVRTPARVGIYDKSHRAPIPSEDALLVKTEEDVAREILLRDGSTSWPGANRYAFYSDGSYHARLEPGQYQIVVAKGMEYRVLQQRVEIFPGKEQRLKLQLTRWRNMPKDNWYSTDLHYHYTRQDDRDDINFALEAKAEDIHLANALVVGTPEIILFNQRWDEHAVQGKDTYFIASGQEAPHTSVLGHGLALNIQHEILAPTTNPKTSLLYDQTFEAARAQGGITGYAHSTQVDYFGAKRGMAIDVPVGLVDYIEVLDQGELYTNLWFDFLNLGFRLSPSAGTGGPYADRMGIERTYVKVEGEFSPAKVFSAIKAGRTFVTNGPMLFLSANHRDADSIINLHPGEALTIDAKALLNPDLGKLDRIELIEQGREMARAEAVQGKQSVALQLHVSPQKGTWFVLRAYGTQIDGKSALVGATAPLYVTINGDSWRDPQAVGPIVQRLKAAMREIFVINGKSASSLSTSEQAEVNAQLMRRIEKAEAVYDAIVGGSGITP